MMSRFLSRRVESLLNCTKVDQANPRRDAPELPAKPLGRFRVGLRSTSVSPDTDLVRNTSDPFSPMIESEVRRDHATPFLRVTQRLHRPLKATALPLRAASLTDEAPNRFGVRQNSRTCA